MINQIFFNYINNSKAWLTLSVISTIFRSLFQHIFYFVRTQSPKGVHQRTEVILVMKQNAPGCTAHQHEGIYVNMKVPSLSPTDLSSSKIIKVKYFIRVSGIPPWISFFCKMKNLFSQVMGLVGDWHENPVIEFPITIGTHPIEHLSSLSLSNDKIKQSQASEKS